MMTDRNSIIPKNKDMPDCPDCKDKSKVVKIIHGYSSPALLEESKRGTIKLGGCFPTPGFQFHCWSCKKDF